MGITAIIVAAGKGSRFGKPKQLELLAGEAVFIHSLRAFHTCQRIEKIILVTHTDFSDEMKMLLAAKKLDSKVTLVLGGQHRQDSVLNGLLASKAEEDDIILVHDAARPLITHRIIEAVIDAAILYEASIAAVPIVDTLKREEGGFAKETISREHLWRAQTPQAARAGLLEMALVHAQNTQTIGTDEADLLSLIGVESFIVHGDENNFKITYIEDLRRAEVQLNIKTI